MPYSLPIFKGYTVDIRLKQFRTVSPNLEIRFIDFDSTEGDKLLEEYIKNFDLRRKSDKKTIMEIANKL